MLRRSKRLTALAATPGAAKDIAGATARGRLGAAWQMVRTASRLPDLGAEKILSREHRYIWLCVPKVASRSIRDALCAVTPDAEVFVGKSIAEVFALRPEARNYYSFAFIRHPFSRALSFYTELHCAAHRYTDAAQCQHKKEKASHFFQRFYGLAGAYGFDAYCQWLQTPYASDAVADRHFLSQHIQLELGNGRLPDYIGRLESLDTDFLCAAEQIGMPKADLPLLNTMAGWQPAPAALNIARGIAGVCLTEENKALLAMRYAKDLGLKGYSPE